jgi:hypothetical protein
MCIFRFLKKIKKYKRPRELIRILKLFVKKEKK